METYRARIANTVKSYIADAIIDSPSNARRLKEHFTGRSKSRYNQEDELSLNTAVSNSAAWILKLGTKSFDLLQGPAMAELGWLAIKRNQRGLSPLEYREAEKVFAGTIPLYRINIDEKSLMAFVGAKFAGARHMGVTTFHTINFTRRLRCTKGSSDMAWLIHELVHVAQMQQVGSQYTVEALHAQFTEGYHYGGPEALENKALCEFNREQQAMIIEDYYHCVLYKKKHRRYGKLPARLYKEKVEEMRRGEL